VRSRAYAHRWDASCRVATPLGQDHRVSATVGAEVVEWASVAAAALHANKEAAVVGYRRGDPRGGGGGDAIDWESDEVSLLAPVALRRSTLLALGGADPMGSCPEAGMLTPKANSTYPNPVEYVQIESNAKRVYLYSRLPPSHFILHRLASESRWWGHMSRYQSTLQGPRVSGPRVPPHCDYTRII
jgi:hypothetical protein